MPSAIRRTGRRVLIIGAGDAGDMIVRMRKSGGYSRGFIDDDQSKLGARLRVRCSAPERPPRVVAATSLGRPWSPFKRHTGTIRNFVRLLEDFKIPRPTLRACQNVVAVRVRQIVPGDEDLRPPGGL